jgi:hypothetical protein
MTQGTPPSACAIRRREESRNFGSRFVHCSSPARPPRATDSGRLPKTRAKSAPVLDTGFKTGRALNDMTLDRFHLIPMSDRVLVTREIRAGCHAEIRVDRHKRLTIHLLTTPESMAFHLEGQALAILGTGQEELDNGNVDYVNC